MGHPFGKKLWLGPLGVYDIDICAIVCMLCVYLCLEPYNNNLEYRGDKRWQIQSRLWRSRLLSSKTHHPGSSRCVALCWIRDGRWPLTRARRSLSHEEGALYAASSI